jgi:hypothetical protein
MSELTKRSAPKRSLVEARIDLVPHGAEVPSDGLRTDPLAEPEAVEVCLEERPDRPTDAKATAGNRSVRAGAKSVGVRQARPVARPHGVSGRSSPLSNDPSQNKPSQNGTLTEANKNSAWKRLGATLSDLCANKGERYSCLVENSEIVLRREGCHDSVRLRWNGDEIAKIVGESREVIRFVRTRRRGFAAERGDAVCSITILAVDLVKDVSLM